MLSHHLHLPHRLAPLPSSPVRLRHPRPFTCCHSPFRASHQQSPPAPPSPRAPPRRGHSSELPILPLIAIFCLGSGSFYFLLKTREGVTHNTYTAGEKAPPKDQWPGRRRDTEQ